MDKPIDVGAVKLWIRSARERAGHSQRSMAEAAGVSRKTIVNLETNGEDVSLGSGTTIYVVLRELGLLRESSEGLPLTVTKDRPDRPEDIEAALERIQAEARGALPLLRALLEGRQPPPRAGRPDSEA